MTREFHEEALAETYNEGLRLEKAGQFDAAADAYRRALALDPEDHGGVSVRLAAMERGAAPAKMPDAYVATLFDQHADVFDDILVRQLGYRVPTLVRNQLRKLGHEHFSRVLDLGCGTGLSGEALRDCAGHITGVDLSERMVETAWDRGVYDDLYTGEAVSFLVEFEEEDGERPSWDLIVATDVFPYLGAVDPIIIGAASRLTPAGFLAFSTETQPEEKFGSDGYLVGSKHRYAHSLDHLRSRLHAAGFECLDIEDIVVRHEEGEPVPGHLVLARLR